MYFHRSSVFINNAGTTKQLHAASFDSEMLPWCKEHELAQLPWMTGTVIMP